jgi:hypothetical protein
MENTTSYEPYSFFDQEGWAVDELGTWSNFDGMSDPVFDFQNSIVTNWFSGGPAPKQDEIPVPDSNVTHSEAETPTFPVQQQLVVVESSPIESVPRPVKKNKTKKGEGKDAFADEDDHYQFQEGHCYCLFSAVEPGDPPAKVLFEICKIVNGTPGIAQGPLSQLKRWAKRRKANAYAWLDRNHDRVPDDVLRGLFCQARTTVGSHCGI